MEHMKSGEDIDPGFPGIAGPLAAAGAGDHELPHGLADDAGVIEVTDLNSRLHSKHLQCVVWPHQPAGFIGIEGCVHGKVKCGGLRPSAQGRREQQGES